MHLWEYVFIYLKLNTLAYDSRRKKYASSENEYNLANGSEGQNEMKCWELSVHSWMNCKQSDQTPYD